MKKRTLGLILFWIGIAWALGWGIVGSIICSFTMHTLTMEQLNESAWALTGSLMMLWGIGGVPLGAVVTGIGMLLYSGVRGSTIWIFGIGILLAIILGSMAGIITHHQFVFGIGGSIILLLFIGILWLWAQDRVLLKDKAAKAADLKLTGYVFILIAAWFTCGIASQPFLKAFVGFEPSSPLHIMIFFVLGWLFLFLGYYVSRKKQNSSES